MLMKLCELPPFAEHMTFENFNLTSGNKEAYHVAQEIASGKMRWLTMCGQTHKGKTHLALAVCQEWLRQNKPARYAYVPRLLSELREGINDGSLEYRFKVYCTIPLLILDDLGSEKSTEWVVERLTTILNERLMKELPLVVTTNCALDALPGDDEHRIQSRLEREYWCRVVEVA